MIREINLDDISDGKLYTVNDMVKVGCNDCEGCSECCGGMGNTILLDPFDIYHLSQGLDVTFYDLMKDAIELNMVDGIILPNLKMTGMSGKCHFLNQNGRCSIHEFRPGICRLFPLGRLYEDQSFQYFLQIQECKKENRSKVKVKKWLGIADIKRYEQFIKDWHYFLKDIQKRAQSELEEKKMKELSMSVLNLFYIQPFDSETDFYQTFYKRLNQAGVLIQQLQ